MAYSNPLVSIILPCYNMERFLSRSVESLLANEYPNKEIILVDDGSTDSTPEIIDALARNHNCIKAIHQPNAGVSSARNTGMDAAGGDYIMFVDPDDYVNEDFISGPLSRIEEEKCDLVVFGYSTPWFTRPQHWTDYPPVKDWICHTNNEVIEMVLPHFFGMTVERLTAWIKGQPNWQDEKQIPTVWRFIYRTQFLRDNNLKFLPLKYGEDGIFVADCLSKANSLATLMKCPYKYEPLPEGAIAASVKPDNILRQKNIYLTQQHRIAKELIDKNHLDILPLYAGSIVMGALQVAYCICNTHSYSTWQQFCRNIQLDQSLRCISASYWGGGI